MTIFSIILFIFALGTLILYTIRKANSIAQVEEDSSQKTEWISRLEKQKLETEKAIRAKEKLDSEEIVKNSDSRRAGELLRDAFKGNDK